MRVGTGFPQTSELNDEVRKEIFWAVKAGTGKALGEYEDDRKEYGELISRCRSAARTVRPLGSTQSRNTDLFIEMMIARILFEALFPELRKLTADEACKFSLKIGNTNLNDSEAEICFTIPDRLSLTDSEKLTIRVTTMIAFAYDLDCSFSNMLGVTTPLITSVSDKSVTSSREQLILLALLSLCGESSDRLNLVATPR